MLKFFKYLLPHWLFVLETRRRQRIKVLNPLAYALNQEEKRSRIELRPKKKTEIFTYQKAIEFLVKEGLDENQIRLGSIPESRMKEVSHFLKEHFGANRTVGIHIGNFLGISLSHLAKEILPINSKSLILAIDPNLTHRGIENPNLHMVKLLEHFGLDQSILLLQGYSLHKSMSNDGENFYAEYDPFSKFHAEHAIPNQLVNLTKLIPSQVDYIFLDGNHHSQYLKEELRTSQHLLQRKGVILIDDVDNAWVTIKELFESQNENHFDKFNLGGRIGVLVKH